MHLLVDSSLSLAEVLRDGRQHAVGVRRVRKRVVGVQLREELLHARSPPLVCNSKHLHTRREHKLAQGCRGGVRLLRDRQ